MEQLISYIENFTALSMDAIDELNRIAEIGSYTKNQIVLKPGQVCNKIWFIKSGMVRKYYIHEGREITVWIHTENDFFTSLQSYVQRIPSEEYLQMCEDTELIGVSRKNSERLAQFPEFTFFVNTLMESIFANIDKHTKELSRKDAKGKYEYLREIAPEIVKRAKLGHIASIIGITQETLSRVRKIV